jgi:hypothetical protein
VKPGIASRIVSPIIGWHFTQHVSAHCLDIVEKIIPPVRLSRERGSVSLNPRTDLRITQVRKPELLGPHPTFAQSLSPLGDAHW